MSVIKIENISKEYRLGAVGHGLLFKDMQSAWARIRGKEDPNRSVSSDDSTNDEKFLALDDVSFAVQQGEVLGVIGQNGAGKSTLLKILSRVTTPSKGRILVKGRIASLLEVGTGFHPELTGRENIFLNGAILGMTRTEVRRKFDEITSFAEIEKFIDTPVKRYSSGMYVRLAFAVAAHLEPEILIVDEVLAVGDVDFQKKCLGKMNEISKKQSRTILFVSHNMGAINEICSRAILLKKGRLIVDSTPRLTTSQYLSKGFDNLTTEFKAEPSTAKSAQVIGIKVTEGRFELGNDIVCKIQYRLNAKVSNVVFSLLISWEGTPLLYSSDTDTNEILTGYREAGTYEATIRLPTSLFKEGLFTIAVFVGHGKDNLSNPDAQVSFEIANTFIDTTRKSYKKDRLGVLFKELAWETKALDRNITD